ncbi:Hsp70 family protein [Vibrio palustris]|uniref:Chaperone protein DnaK n=1 Tax=Vibrio palustris TaxID=1918946 RepID=A0A1R4B2B8_9VIBR|nr:Hsp70 family protein [Vibrio palustris]SJL83062.1 Chaperone protein DnaK [Vibrio palustris]
MATTAQFLVGIDLGTTNTVVAYCELTDNLAQQSVEIFPIDQLIGPGEVARKPLLPSFRYHPAEQQFAATDMGLPWDNHSVDGDLPHVILGEWARELGTRVEGRQVSSAKSWLSHTGVDRTQPILPWAGTSGVEKVSPIVASASYLNHIRQAWNYHHPNQPLEQQEVVVTVPASFDESARKFTLQAAALAGLHNIVLLEEPQAVVYDWYARHQETAHEELNTIPLILVCDVGGGTTDLSLISTTFNDEQLALNRIGVGDHLMLGGDNVDLALAHLAEQRFGEQTTLNAASLTKLIQQTRKAKETLLADDAPEQAKITLLGSGSRLLGGTKSIGLSRDDVHNIALDGFFPMSALTDTPDSRRSAMVEFGLPYVADPAVSKHIAAFIHQHQSVARDAMQLSDEDIAVPVGLLLNGGAFNSRLITDRMTQLMDSWGGKPVTLLDNPSPDCSVALGAVAYGKARRGAQLTIGGGAARSYFLHLPHKKSTSQALCLLAKGTEEGQEIRLTSRRFSLTLDEPVRFNLLTSTHERMSNNQPVQNGALFNVDPDKFTPLPPYITTLKSNDVQALKANQKHRVEVQLACQLTEVGTLKMECVSSNDDRQRWEVEFAVRGEDGVSLDEESSSIPSNEQSAMDLLSKVYSGNKSSTDPKTIKTLNKTLEKRLGKREKWEFITLRRLFDTLLTGRKRRRRSELHEQHWLRLAGYTLRPGFGDSTDGWRIEQIWPLYQQGIQFPSHSTWSDWWTFWRRVSGGLNQEQQETLLGDIAKYLHPGAARNTKNSKETQDKGYEAMVRLAASLEHLDVEDKTLLATWFLNKALKNTQFRPEHWWALGRIATRVPLYGSAHNVVPREQVQQWLPKLLEQDWQQDTMAAFAAVMMCRKSGDRTLDISDDVRQQVLKKLNENKVPDSWYELVNSQTALSERESQRAYGDALPTGLFLIN